MKQLDFPHLDDTKFPIIDNVNVYKYQNNFDYARWNGKVSIKLLNVLWNSDYTDVPYFNSVEERDSWFDEQKGYVGTLESLFNNTPENTVKIPIPYNDAYNYNYLIVDMPMQTSASNPINYEDSKIRVKRWFYFIEDMTQFAPSTTELHISVDYWTTFIHSVEIPYLMLERGHAPMVQTKVADFLANPIANNEYLLADDFNYGNDTVIQTSNYLPIGNGKKYILFCAPYRKEDFSKFDGVVWSGNATPPTYSNTNERWGYQIQVNDYQWRYGKTDYSDADLPINNMIQTGILNGCECFAIEGTEARSFFNDMANYHVNFIHGIQAMFMLDESLFTRSDSFTFNGYTIYIADRKINNLNLSFSKEQFGFDSKYAEITKLYTFPYSSLEITDDEGNAFTAKIENCGRMQMHTEVSLVYPFLNYNVFVSGINGDGTMQYKWENIQGTNSDKTMWASDFSKFMMNWNIPVYAIYVNAETEYAANNAAEMSVKRLGAIKDYENAVRYANTTRENTADSFTTNTTNIAANGTANTNNVAASGATNTNNVAASGATNTDNVFDIGTTNVNNVAASGQTNTNNVAASGQTNTDNVAASGQTNTNNVNRTTTKNVDNTAATQKGLVDNKDDTNNNADLKIDTYLDGGDISQIGGSGGYLSDCYDANLSKLSDDNDADLILMAQTYTLGQEMTVATAVLNAAGSIGGGIANGAVTGGMAFGIPGAVGMGVAEGIANGVSVGMGTSLTLTNNENLYSNTVDQVNAKFRSARDCAMSLTNAQKTYNGNCKDADNDLRDSTVNRFSGTNGINNANESRNKTCEDSNASETQKTNNANAVRTQDTNNTNADRTQATDNANAGRTRTTNNTNAKRIQDTDNANAVRTQNTNNANAERTKNTNNANAVRTQTTETNNATYIRNATIEAEKANLVQKQREAEAQYKNARLQSPAVYSSYSGDFAQDVYQRRGIRFNVRTQSKSAIAQTGDAMLRFGYALHRAWDMSNGFHYGKQFTFWKAEDIWINDGSGVANAATDTISRILMKGVTIWRNPDKIGMVGIYDNI